MVAHNEGERIVINANGKVEPCHHPIVPYIEGDGIGADIWPAARMVLDAAVQSAYQGNRSIAWKQVWAGEASFRTTGSWLPEDTVRAFEEFHIGIKGPLTTPVGGGMRSLNVALRQALDLYQCVRPVRWYPNVPSPVKNPAAVNMVIFRENTEDVYAGLDYEPGSDAAERLAKFLRNELRARIPAGTLGLGVKPVSEFGSKRLVRAAIRWALENKRQVVTLVHKGNIMKYTEGAFCRWGYEVAREEFADWVALASDTGGQPVPGKILVNDIIADNMFQQALVHPEKFDVLATTNLNGDYLSDALAAQVGGLGIAPGANIGDAAAVFEATHGTAPSMAGKDTANPLGVILSGKMMLEFLGWNEAAITLERAIEKTLSDKVVTKDFARTLTDARSVSCSEFGRALSAAMSS